METERTTRLLEGGFVVFCKSGKDRTGMAVTLGAAMLAGQADAKTHAAAAAADPACAQEKRQADERLMLQRADVLREYGTRLLVAHKNTGRMKYAFNVLQREFLPYPYKPPLSCIENLIDSAVNRDTS